MKRRLVFTLALVLLVTIAFGCAASYPATPEPAGADDAIDVAAVASISPGLPPTGSGTSRNPLSYWQGLYLYVAPGSVSPTGLRLSAINSSQDITFGHGVPFTIEQ